MLVKLRHELVDYATLSWWQRLQYWRKTRGFTQDGLAAASNTDTTTISNMERGQRPGLSIGTLLKLCLALEIDPRELFPTVFGPSGLG